MKKVAVLFFTLVFVANIGRAQKEDRFTIVYNNVPSNKELKTDWGFAAWIETGGNIILFDTGTKAKILQDNFRKLNFDPSNISVVAISHEHGDHTGGLTSVLEVVQKGTKIYLPNNYKPGLSKEFPKMKFVVNDRYRKITNGVWLTEIFIDSIRGIKEQALVLIKNEKLIVITGCAHPGIAQMCEAIKTKFSDKKLELVTGGFHLMSSTDKKVSEISTRLKDLGFQQVAPSHCTGDNSIAIFKKEWDDKFVQLNLGDSYAF